MGLMKPPITTKPRKEIYRMKNKFDFAEWWDKGLGDWSLDRILEKLNSFGVNIDKEKFLALTEKYASSETLADLELYPRPIFLLTTRKRILSGWLPENYGKG
jgi:hypothetical protein